jgi:membrane-bound ClpP family serine protease
MTTDLVATLVGYLMTVGSTLLWVFWSKQQHIPRTRRTAVCLSLRTLLLFAVFLLGCRLLGVNTIVAFASLGVFVFVVLTGWAFGPLSLGVLGLLYIVQQWILGWPERSDFVLDAPTPAEDRSAHLDRLIGASGVASCPLRPGGTIALGESQYPARSDLGYIERGTLVKVVGRKEGSLLVRPTETEPEDTGPASGKSSKSIAG